MRKSVNYGLNKPDYSDQYDLRHWNDNMDIVDSQMKSEETSRINADALKENLSNKVTSFQSTPDNTHYPSEKLVKDNLDLKENLANKKTSWSATPNDNNYPSEKLVKKYVDDEIDALENRVESNIIAHGAKYDDDGNSIRDFYEWKNRKVSSFGITPNDTNYPTEKLVKDSLNLKEDSSNKVTSFQSTPDNTHYPSEKLVKDSLDGKINKYTNHANNIAIFDSNGQLISKNIGYGALTSCIVHEFEESSSINSGNLYDTITIYHNVRWGYRPSPQEERLYAPPAAIAGYKVEVFNDSSLTVASDAVILPINVYLDGNYAYFKGCVVKSKSGGSGVSKTVYVKVTFQVINRVNYYDDYEED